MAYTLGNKLENKIHTMIDLQHDGNAIREFITASARRICSEELAPVRAFGIQCSALDGIIHSSYDKSPASCDSSYGEIIANWDMEDFDYISFNWDESYYECDVTEVKEYTGCIHAFADEAGDIDILRPIFESLKLIIEPILPVILAETGASVVALNMGAADLVHQWHKEDRA
jgi:hypothetical protein